MTNSDSNRKRFEMIGGDRLAAALGAGKFQSLGLTEDMKSEAMEWLAEQRTKEASERKQTLRWAIIAGRMSIASFIIGAIGVGVSIAAIFVAVWLAK